MLLHMVAGMVAGMVADIGAGTVADKVAGMVPDMTSAIFKYFAGINFSLSLTISGEYIEEVQKQLEVVVVVREEKIKAGRRCSATQVLCLQPRV